MDNITTKEILSRVDFLAPLESQREYRQEIASFIRMHLTRVKAIENGVNPHSLPLVSMLVIAETGCGKTYVASQIAKASGVNFITIDCSTLARASWKGINLANAILSERDKCSNKHKFDRSIILLDEFDKTRMHPSRSDEGNPQPNFLRMFDGELQAELGNGNMENIDTSKMSFIFAGAFANGLADIVKERITPKRTIGFSAAPAQEPDGNVLKYATFGDIQEYGIMGELCGRIGSLIYLPPLTNMDYRTLIKGEQGSALMRYKNLFGSMGIDVDVTDEVCDYIAESATKGGLGARSINSALFLNLQKAYEAIEDHPDVNKVVLELQATDTPGLSFEFGERSVKKATEVKLAPKTNLVPSDINFSFELRTKEGARDVAYTLIEAYCIDNEADRADVDTLTVFLDCVLCYFKDNVNPNEMTLISLEKMAQITKVYPEYDESTFDTLMKKAIGRTFVLEEEDKLPEGEEKPCELELKYRVFKSHCKRDPHEFLVSSIRKIRKSWYKRLLDSLEETEETS